MKILATIQGFGGELPPAVFELIEEDEGHPLLLFNPGQSEENKWLVLRLSPSQIIDLENGPSEKEYVGELRLEDLKKFTDI